MANDLDERVYKEYVSQTFNRTALSYDRVGPRFFSHFGHRLVELAGVCNGASVLDVGCGRGAILFPAAERVGRSGEVIGIDMAETMVQQTTNDIEALGLENARVCHMDAEALGLPKACFDFAIYGFVLYEFYDLDPALSEAFRVLKPNGVMAASLWGRNVDRRWDGFRSVMKSYQGLLKPAPEAKNVPRLREPADIAAVLSKAGFANIQTVVEEKEFYFKDVDEWWAFEWSHGNRFLWERMEAPILERCRGELFEVIGQMKQEAGIPIVFQILLTRAEKPPVAIIGKKMATRSDGSTSRRPCWVTWSYQEPHEKVRALSREMRKRGMRKVLDLGCGAGRHTVYLAQEGFEVYALDISPEAVELTAQWLTGEGLQANLQQADMSALPYRDAFFDGIVSVSVLHHNINAKIRTAMGEIRRVLRPGGVFFARECAKGDYQEGRGEQIENGTYLAPEDADQPGVPHHFFGEDEVRALLHGFRVVELERVGEEFVDGSGRRALSVRWDILAEKGAITRHAR